MTKRYFEAAVASCFVWVAKIILKRGVRSIISKGGNFQTAKQHVADAELMNNPQVIYTSVDYDRKYS